MTTVTEGEEITEGTVGIMKQNALQLYNNSIKKIVQLSMRSKFPINAS